MVVSTDSIALLELSVVANTEHHLLAARNFKATPIGNYVSGPPPASFSTESEFSEIHREYARIRFLKKLDFRNKYWAATNMLNLTTYVSL